MPPKKKANIVKEEAQATESQPEQQLEAPAEPARPNPALEHSDTLYFATGDIALYVGGLDDEEPAVVFRVDKAFLVRHSSVLAAKFGSLADPGTRKKRYDGVPLIALDDNYDSFEDLLRFMYNPACVDAPCAVQVYN